MKFDIKKIKIHNAQDIYEIMQMIFKREKQLNPDKEHFWVMALDNASKIINLELVALGSVKRVVVKPMEVLSIPLQKRASGLFLIHNHPSGSLAPSEEDKDVTDRLIQACRIMETPVLDHIIITEHSYYSFKHDGLLERLEASNKYVMPYELEKHYYEEMKGHLKTQEKLFKANLKKKQEMALKEGEQIGMEKGMEVRNLEIAQMMLTKGYTPDEVEKLTGVQAATINKTP